MKKLNLFIAFIFLLLLHAYTQSFDWAKRVTGSGDIRLNDMVTDASGNIYVVGSFTGAITLGSQNYNAQGTDIWLARYNSSGNFLWGKAIPDTGTSPGDDFGYSITLDGSNNVYICGQYTMQKDFNPGGSGGTAPDHNNMNFFAKYTSSGAFQWVKTVRTSGLGFQAIAFSQAQNRIYIGGGFSSNNVDFDPNPGEVIRSASNGQAFIARYTLNGTIDDVRNFGSSSTINDLAIDPTGNVYATGLMPTDTLITSVNFNPSGSGSSFDPANGHMFIAKYSSSLGFISASQVLGGNDPNWLDEGFSVTAPSDNEIFYGGRVNGGLYLARRNSSFSLVYQKYYGGDGAVEAITKSGSSLYFTASSTSGTAIGLGNGVTLDPLNSGDMLIAKTSPTGTATWGTVIAVNNGNGQPKAVAAGGSNEFILAGHFTGSSDFNACFNSTSLTANGRDGFMVKYSGGIWSDGVGPISGPSLICTFNSTFTVQNLPAGATVNWSASPTSLFAVDSGTGSSFFTRATSSSSSGQGTITAAILGDCGNVQIQKQVWVGRPSIQLDEIDNTVCIQPHYTFCGPEVDGPANYQWSLNTTDLHMVGGGRCITVNNSGGVAYGESKYFTITLTMSAGSCSQTNSLSTHFYQPDECDCGIQTTGCSGDGGGGIRPTVVLAPNPATDEVAISFENEQELEDYFATTGTLQVLITDLTGNEKYRGALNKNGLKVNLKHAQPGIHIVKVSGKDFEQQVRLLIE